MATKAKKPVLAKARAVQTKIAADDAARPKDSAKPAFGKAPPKKVVPAAAKVAPKAKKPANGNSTIAGRAARTVKATANVAAGAVIVAARLAASVVGRGGSKAKTKAK
ncbi:hypothetical protein [Mesorhizobium sp.]|uniref:hypothetical protein n=1 Tax=Mesorhizobium sp. TaxID=1871066 RepID=UPI003BAC8BBA